MPLQVVQKQVSRAQIVADRVWDLPCAQDMFRAMLVEMLEGGSEHAYIARLRDMLDSEWTAHFQRPDPADAEGLDDRDGA